jgi:2-iminobutanoate/2-iminopropanoate deaminase
LNDFSILNETFIEFFGKTNFPARSTVEVAGLPLGARVEIDCVAIES